MKQSGDCQISRFKYIPTTQIINALFPYALMPNTSSIRHRLHMSLSRHQLSMEKDGIQVGPQYSFAKQVVPG